MKNAWRWLRIFAGTLVVIAATGAGAVALGPRADIVTADAATRPERSPSLSMAPPTTVAAPIAPVVPTAPVEPPLPVPAGDPGDGWAAVPIVPIANLSIPKIGLTTTVNEGVEQSVLAVGPGHWPGTALPGGWGNTVIAAHRVTHGGPFHDIAQLGPGDSIILSAGGQTFTYLVTGSEIITPADGWIVDQHPGRTLTLFSCHPIGSSTQRYVVHAQLVTA